MINLKKKHSQSSQHDVHHYLRSVLSSAGAARARAGLCVVGGAAHSAASSVHVLSSVTDGHAKREDALARRALAAATGGDRGSSEGSAWVRYPLPRTPRVHAAVASLSGDVYLLVSFAVPDDVQGRVSDVFTFLDILSMKSCQTCCGCLLFKSTCGCEAEHLAMCRLMTW